VACQVINLDSRVSTSDKSQNIFQEGGSGLCNGSNGEHLLELSRNSLKTQPGARLHSVEVTRAQLDSLDIPFLQAGKQGEGANS